MVKQVDCSECAFLIQDENGDELIAFVQRHAEDTHGMSTSREEVQGRVTEA